MLYNSKIKSGFLSSKYKSLLLELPINIFSCSQRLRVLSVIPRIRANGFCPMPNFFLTLTTNSPSTIALVSGTSIVIPLYLKISFCINLKSSLQKKKERRVRSYLPSNPLRITHLSPDQLSLSLHYIVCYFRVINLFSFKSLLSLSIPSSIPLITLI